MKSGYDGIASIYDIDMGRNMPFDDVGAYRDLARRTGSTVLEVGCGEGRVAIPLALSGFDVIGIDRSIPMLRQFQKKIPEPPPNLAIFAMDARAFYFRRLFDLILFPYSGVTYLTGERDLAAFFTCVRGAMAKEGLLLLDAFIPREITAHARFQMDYVRPMDSGGILKRWKRITPEVRPGINRVERRYQICDREGAVLERLEMDELIRCFNPQQLQTLCL
ncbi:MAG: class I SAM-dependent methyltransferase, partial [Desulfobacterales bacterium]|nr:class I SAM-dependent methyltransferase [Desulfobacterales bacterium]